MKKPHNKASLDPLAVIVGIVLIIIVAGIILNFVWKGSTAGKKDLTFLSSCQSRNGGLPCSGDKSKTDKTFTCFENYGGCPPIDKPNDKYCCISNKQA